MTPHSAFERPHSSEERDSQKLPTARTVRRVMVSGCADELELLIEVAGRYGCEVSNVSNSVAIGVGFTAAIVGDDGEHTLEICKSLSRSGPVVLVTARISLDFRLAASEAGVAALLQRPVRPIELSEWLASFADLDSDQPCSVLIVDDDVMSTQIKAAFLRSAGMDVSVINDPTLVLAYLERSVPDIVLMDVQMPGIDGIRLTRIIRQSRRFVSMPIVFLSSEEDEARQLAARRLGGDDFVLKPVAPEKLIEIVRLRTERSTVLRSMIERDRLTGLLNQTSFRDRLLLELERCKRAGVELSLAVLDIDHFKQVNDVHGHSVGDMVLRALAGTLQTKLRRVDIVGRLGGEEFGILLPHTDAEAAGRVVDRLRIEFGSQSFEAAAGGFGVTFSAGITSNSVFDNEMLEMINGADESLYEAKRQGRNCVVIHEACLRRMSATP